MTKEPTPPFLNLRVQEIYESYPQSYREKLLKIRGFIFKVASMIKEVGEIEEAVKWGEPSYLTSIRLSWHASRPDEYAIYFNCKTSLIESFRAMYGNLYQFTGNSIIFALSSDIHEKPLSECIVMALTYHLKRK